MTEDDLLSSKLAERRDRVMETEERREGEENKAKDDVCDTIRRRRS